MNQREQAPGPRGQRPQRLRLTLIWVLALATGLMLFGSIRGRERRTEITCRR